MIICVRPLEEEGLVVPGTERQERLFEVRTVRTPEAIIGFHH